MNTSVAGKRPLGALGRIGMVAGLHAGALYLIAASLGVVPAIIEKEPPVATLLEEREPVSDPVPIVEPRAFVPDVWVPAPEEPVVDQPVSESAIHAQVRNDPPVITEFIPATPQAVLVGVRHDSRYPLTQPTYPARDIREGNEGSVELEVYVLPTGRIGDVRVIRSTGSPTLDQSAIDEAKRRWRMLPATRDGEPYAQWHRLKVTFDLRDR
jgi:protein TonB